jgi:tRNA (guanine37-N1)-methyltransferase
MRFDIVTLFPEMFGVFAEQGVTGRAFQRGLAELVLHNPREYTSDVHRTVDDRPYGGGPGMVMKPQPLRDAILAAKAGNPGPVVYLSPQGQRFDQDKARATAESSGITLVAGRYEGIDERIIEHYIDEEWSIGDYVLSGGEPAALVVIDTITRLIPGVLGAAESAAQDSHMNGLLDCPHYTRPVEFEGLRVPDILASGDHQRIRRWRLQQALERTWLRRPDMLEGREFTSEEQHLLNDYLQAQERAD